MNVGEATNSYLYNGEKVNKETDIGLQANSGIQSAHGLSRDGFGSTTTHGDIVSRRGSDEGGSEADLMEFEGGGEIETFV